MNDSGALTSESFISLSLSLEVEPEVELPARTTLLEDPLLVSKRQAKLDDLEQVHITLEALVMVIRRVSLRHRPRHNSRELRVHRDVWVCLYEVSDGRHFFLEVERPHVADLERLVVVSEGAVLGVGGGRGGGESGGGGGGD